MAGLDAPIAQTQTQTARLRNAAIRVPRLLMSWEDWLTLVPAIVVYVSIAVAIQQADWVRDFPSLAPTLIGGLIIGLLAARTRGAELLVQPIALLLGVIVITLAVQEYADGASLVDRVADIRIRMQEWWGVVRARDVSNDNLPFVLLVHGLGFLGAYMAAWAIFRWRNIWLSVVPAGIGLLVIIATTDGQPSIAFLLFSIGSLLLIARLHLQREQVDWLRDRVDYPEFLSISAGQIAVVISVILVVVAWVVPLGKQASAAESVLNAITNPIEARSGPIVSLFNDLSGGSGNFHKFGGTLAIRGDVSLGSRLLFDAQTDFGGLVRGASYDEYTGAGWKSTDRQSEKVDAGTALTAAIEGRIYQERVVTELDITVFDGEDTLFSVGTPLGTNVDSVADLPETFLGDIERIRSDGGLDEGARYRVLGSVSIATPEQLRTDSTVYPDWVVERYLQLPDDLPERVADESLRVSAGAANPFDVAINIEAYLREFEVDLTVPSTPSRRDVVDYFLFDLQRGYFDYFSTAMTVMLRTQGVPARVAVGYVLDPEDVEAGTFSVRKDDAYSWVEVFFPTYGWLEFNPSGDLPAGVGGFGPGVTPANNQTPEIPFEPLPVDELFGGGEEAQLDALLGGVGDPASGGGAPWLLIWSLGGALLVAALIALSGRLYWLWGLRGLDGVPRQWASVERLAGWAGFEPSGDESARRWGDRVGDNLAQQEAAVALSTAYEETRYGPPDLERVDAEETAGSYRLLRNALFGRVFGRKPGRRPADESGDEPDDGGLDESEDEPLLGASEEDPEA